MLSIRGKPPESKKCVILPREVSKTPDFLPNILKKSILTSAKVLPITLVMIFGFFCNAQAALNVPSGSTFNVNTGTIIVTGGVDNNGTLVVTTGSINVLSGNWDNTSGVFTSGTGLVQFSGSTLQTIDTGGASNDQDFNDLTYSGSNTLRIINNTVDIDDDFTLAVGATLDANGQTMEVGGDWTNSGTFTANSGTVNLDHATSSTVTGNTTFYNLTANTAAKTILFADGSTQTVNNLLTLAGAAGVGNKITLDVVGGGTDWNINVPNGAQTVQYLTVSNSNALNNTITCLGCTDGGNNNANWIFSSIVITVPQDGKTVDTTPTVIGTSQASCAVTIKDSGSNTVATTTSDTSGNFRVETDALPVGANTLTAHCGVDFSDPKSVTVQANPSTTDVPVIDSPAENGRITDANPTITGFGAAGQNVTILAKDAAGTLLLQSVGTGVVDASGNFSVTLSTAMPKGASYLSATVNGVASHIVKVLFVDPFGVVFNAETNELIKDAIVSIYRSSDNQLAVVGTDLDPLDVNPVVTGADGFYSFLTISGNYYIVVQAPGYTYPSTKTTFPSGRTIVTGSKGEIFAVGATVIEMDHPVDASGNAIRIVKTANKSQARIGDVVTYSVEIESLTDLTLNDVQIKDLIPPGFKYLGDRVTYDGVKIGEPAGNRPLYFNVGTLAGRSKHTLKYQLVIGSGVTQGDYNNRAIAQYASGYVLSNASSKTVRVVLDPLFDLSNVIGKIFYDHNKNGVQDGPGPFVVDGIVREELPVPNVGIVMEDGTVITSDDNGKYSVPNILPGRHVFRLDERTLPQGTYLTTEKAVIVDVRPGIPSKVNFGVAFEDPKQQGPVSQFEENIRLKQNASKPVPRLNVALFGDTVKIYDKKTVEPVEFRVFTNYSAFIDTWELNIADGDTGKNIRKFSGTRNDIYAPILWDGKDSNGEMIRMDRNYEFYLKVSDAKEHSDETTPQSVVFTVFDAQDDVSKYFADQKETREESYQDWMRDQSMRDHREVQGITVDGETIIVEPVEGNIRSLQVYQNGSLITEMNVRERREVQASDLLEGKDIKPDTAPVEMILPKGDYKINVIKGSEGSEGLPEAGSVIKPIVQGSTAEIIPTGNEAADNYGPAQVYSQDINVGGDYLFFVGMGDAEAGYNMSTGNIEPVETSDKFRDGFWADGKMAYYLKGKIKGKYLVTSSYDSERNQKEIFRSLNNDQYYPVYGDASDINYDATNTQGNLYVMIEWDKSSAQWGNYPVGFNDTELAQFNRSLYGGKVAYESLSKTKFGTARTKSIVFRARAQQKAAHNEFLATGGSLYYLKNRDVIEGSEKIKLQVRDKVTGLVLTEKSVIEGTDYEIDYHDGRIIFFRPVQALVESQSIISDELLNGNYAYVVADYEYEVLDKFDQSSSGARVKQAVTDYVEVGGTYVKDSQQNNDYTLKGMDTTLHINKDTKIKAEYAESESQAQDTFVSTDGGISFTGLATGDNDSGQAYLLKGDTRLFNRIGFNAYYEWIQDSFSTASSSSQQGKKLTGFAATYDMFSNTRFTAKQDIQQLINSGNAQTEAQVGAQRTVTSLFQVVHEIHRLRLTGEYRKQQVTDGKEEYEATSNQEQDIVAVKAEYDINEKLTASIEQQKTIAGVGATQTKVGITDKFSDKLTLRAAQTVGSEGSASAVGATYNVNNKIDMTGDYALLSKPEGIGNAASVGATAHLTNDTSFNTSVGVKDEPGSEPDTASLTFGGKTKVDAKTDAEGSVVLSQTSTSGTDTALTMGTERKLNEELSLASKRTVSQNQSAHSNASTYELTRDKDGRKLTGSYSKATTETASNISRTNIFGLTGDVNDRWALTGTYERGLVQNLDATETNRNALSFGAAYFRKDEYTGRPILSSSSKAELRLDDGNEDSRQYLLTNATEGQVSDELTVFNKWEYSKTRNTTTGRTSAEHKEFMLGAAFRPLTHDRLNLISRYTYLNNLAPLSQEDISDIEDEKAHVFSTEAIYDLTTRWQFVEKWAYRLAEEKVTGFEMNRTHTWLMAHRLNYNLDYFWSLGAEYRVLTQEEAQDKKSGFLVEATRKMGEYAKLGVGFNFTNFSDDLTELSYKSFGPFVRLTGTIYDQTPEEIERMKRRQVEAQLEIWSTIMAQEDLKVKDPEKLAELNYKFVQAQVALETGDVNRAVDLFESILSESDKIFGKAANYIRSRVERELALREMSTRADELYARGQYEEAKRILQDILVESDSLGEKDLEQMKRELRLQRMSRRADELYAQGRYEEAQDLLEDILIKSDSLEEKDKDQLAKELRLQKMSRQADDLYAEGRYEEAQKILQNILIESDSLEEEDTGQVSNESKLPEISRRGDEFDKGGRYD